MTTDRNNQQPNDQPLAGSLDDLFAAARSEARELESSEAKQAILNDVMHPTSTLRPASMVTRSLHGMRMSIRAKIMTTLSIGAAALIAISFLHAPKHASDQTASAVTQPSSNQEVTSGGTANADQTLATSLPDVRAAFTPSVAAATERTAKVELHPDPVRSRDTGMWAPVDLQGIKPVIATPEEMKKLAIVLAPNGNITYFYRADGHEPSSMTLLPVAGVNIEVGTAKGAQLPELSSIPENWPRIITNADGTRRLFQFSSNTTTKIPGLNSGAPEDSFGVAHVATSVVAVGLPPDDMAASSTTQDEDNTPEEQDNAPEDQDNAPGEHFEQHFVRKIVTDTVSADGIHHIDTVITNALNNGLPGSSSIASRVNVDSILQALGINKHQHGQVKVVVNANVDAHDTTSGTPRMMQRLMQLRASKDSAMKFALNAAKRTLDALRNGKLTSIDNLVPVLVQNHEGAVANDLIFWYEPSPELAKVLPQGIIPSAVATQAGAMKEITLYPNPANTSATVHFTLSDTRSIQFSVYSLLGQKLLDAGTLSAQSGAGEMKLDLSSLTPGVYLLIASTDRGEQLTQRIVIER